MRVFAISDLHIDYKTNKLWLTQLSRFDYQKDLLIVAGDVSDDMGLLEFCFEQLDKLFFRILFLPGNHELWVRKQAGMDSMEKFHLIQALAKSGGIESVYRDSDNLIIVPLYAWYDFSFGEPSPVILQQWMDFKLCRWPEAMTLKEINLYFLTMNQNLLQEMNQTQRSRLISYSHFLPRIDLIPGFVPKARRIIDPLLGSESLGNQVKILQPDIHVYGHSHINRRAEFDGTQFINNAYGYPTETGIARKQLICIYES